MEGLVLKPSILLNSSVERRLRELCWFYPTVVIDVVETDTKEHHPEEVDNGVAYAVIGQAQTAALAPKTMTQCCHSERVPPQPSSSAHMRRRGWAGNYLYAPSWSWPQR